MVAWISGGWLQTTYTSYRTFCSDMRLLSIVNIGLLLFPGSEHVLNQAHPPQECQDLMYLILPVQNLTALLGRINCFDLFLQPSQLSFGQDQLFGRHHHIIHASPNPLLPNIFRAVSAQFWRMQQDRNQPVQSFQSTRFLGNAERDGAVAESCKLV